MEMGENQSEYVRLAIASERYDIHRQTLTEKLRRGELKGFKTSGKKGPLEGSGGVLAGHGEGEK